MLTTVKIIVAKHKTNKMESLTDSQQEIIRKMSSERIQRRLMSAGLDEDEVYAMNRPDLLEAMAKVIMDGENVAAAAVRDSEPKTDIQLQFDMMKLQVDF